MTPKEKAQELVNKMCNIEERFGSVGIYEGKECALIAVDEILEATKTIYKWGGGSPEKLIHVEEVKYDTYWQEVKQEIENYGKVTI